MATSNVFSTPDNVVGNLNGFFKEQYADKLKDLIPEGLKIINAIPFAAKEKQGGNLFHQPVILGMEHGVTFASSDDDAFNLLPAIAGQIKDAQVRGNPMVMRSILGYAAASRAMKGGSQSFMEATKYLVSNMLRSMSKKLEIQMLYGQKGYAKAGANVLVGTPTVIEIAAAEWAPGIWAGAEGMPIDIYAADLTTLRGTFVVASVDMDAKTITCTTSAFAAGVVSTDVIFHKGAKDHEFAGIHKILETTSGVMFNINVGSYNLFKGNSYDVAGALSFNKLTRAAARPVEKGLDSKLTVFVNPRGWADLLNDQAALRKYDQSYSPVKTENGSKAIVFHSQNGDLEIIPSIYVKEGYAYGLALEEWSRVGSSDITFKRPGQGEDFFRDLENSAGYEMRLYTDQAVFCCAPGKNVLLTGIVNAA
jgi:hypothetical protein